MNIKISEKQFNKIVNTIGHKVYNPTKNQWLINYEQEFGFALWFGNFRVEYSGFDWVYKNNENIEGQYSHNDFKYIEIVNQEKFNSLITKLWLSQLDCE